MLKNQRIDNFYKSDDNFYIKIYVKNKGNRFFVFKIGTCCFIDDNKDGCDSSFPENFVLYLRKYLNNSYITDIKQVESERIIDFKIEKKENDDICCYHLMFEMFAKGNVILCDDNYIIKNSLIKRKYKDRAIMVSDKYELPPKKDFSIFNMDYDYFMKKTCETRTEIVKFIATEFGFGGKYAEEVCIRSGIEKGIYTNNINQDIAKKLICSAIELTKIQIKPFGVIDDNDDKLINDFIPYLFKSFSDKKLIEFETFNELIKAYYSQHIKAIDKKQTDYENKMKSLNVRLLKQMEQLKSIEDEIEFETNKGNLIYSNYALVEDIIKNINLTLKEKGSDFLKEKIKESDKLKKIIKKLDLKEQSVNVEL